MTRQNYIFLLSRTKKRLYFFPEYKKSTIFAHVFADMAQLVEQRIRNAWVRGSSPLIGFSKMLGEAFYYTLGKSHKYIF